MQEKFLGIPIKLKSLREEREISRSRSNRPTIDISPVIDMLKTSSEENLKIQNRTPMLSRFRKIDSPKNLYETKKKINIQLIEKANAAMEVLEVNRPKPNVSSLLHKGKDYEKKPNSGLIYKFHNKIREHAIPKTPPKEIVKKRVSDLHFEDNAKIKRLSRAEEENLINRLQGGNNHYLKH